MHSYTPSPHRPYLNPGTLPKGTIGKWYLPAMAMIALGFGISNYYMSTPPQRVAFDPAEEERLRRNKELMDAYGDKETIQDIERALSLYELQ